jgi:hypothetical protein
MKISLDFDGTIANTMKRWLEIYNIHYPSNKKYYNDIQRWAFNKDFGVSDTEFFDFLKMVWEGYEDLEPVESNIDEHTNDIRQMGHIVDIVTSVLPTHVKYVEKWLSLNQISYDELIHAANDKLELDYDLYIDDRPSLFTNISQSDNKYGIIYNQPWNGKDNLLINVLGKDRIKRAYNWSEIVKTVESL